PTADPKGRVVLCSVGDGCPSPRLLRINAAGTGRLAARGWLVPEPRYQLVAGSERESCWRLRKRCIYLIIPRRPDLRQAVPRLLRPPLLPAAVRVLRPVYAGLPAAPKPHRRAPACVGHASAA